MEGEQVGGYLKRLSRTRLKHHDALLAVLDPTRINCEGATEPVEAEACDSALELRKGQADALIPLVQFGWGNDSIQSISKRAAPERGEELAQAVNIRPENFYVLAAPILRITGKIPSEGFKH